MLPAVAGVAVVLSVAAVFPSKASCVEGSGAAAPDKVTPSVPDGVPTTKSTSEESPPPGTGVCTVTATVASVFIKLAVTVATSVFAST
jgi:hypothetical protein